MDFARLGFDSSRTIAAIATAPGNGGVAIIRISGPQALSIASGMFSKDLLKLPSHQAVYGQIVSQGKVIDHGLALIFLGTRSFTGETTVEFQCHGGQLLAEKVLKEALRSGAKPAHAGEFTQKAFFNGKIDLLQAEAIQTMIEAQNTLSLDIASKQLEGKFSGVVDGMLKQLLHVAAIVEAAVDYPEEDLEFASTNSLIATMKDVSSQLQHILSTYDDGRKIQSGFSLCLLGRPNVGKSSLLNALLGYDRAIVTEIEGTTRDFIEEELTLRGVHYTLIDTAGIRNTDEIVEKEGIKRSLKKSETADIQLFLIDASKPLSDEELDLLTTLDPKKAIIVRNKIDLGVLSHKDLKGFSVFDVSAKEQQGLDELLSAIEQCALSRTITKSEMVIVTKERHFEALSSAKAHFDNVIDGLKSGISIEFVSFDLRMGLKDLNELLGKNISEEILDTVFSTFCVGK